MKMNLFLLIKNERLMVQLNRFVMKNNADSARNLLAHYFPSKSIQFTSDHIVLEMADLCCGLAEDPEPFNDLISLRQSTQHLIHYYLERKALVCEHDAWLHYHCQRDYTAMTPQQRQACGYNTHMINTFLQQLDARDAYRSYSDGYEYERYQAYEWLLHQINETLEKRTHETAKAVRDLI